MFNTSNLRSQSMFQPRGQVCDLDQWAYLSASISLQSAAWPRHGLLHTLVAKCFASFTNAVSLPLFFKASRLFTSFAWRCKSVKPFISHQKILCNCCLRPVVDGCVYVMFCRAYFFLRLLRILSAASQLLLLDLTATLSRSILALPAPIASVTSSTNPPSRMSSPDSQNGRPTIVG